MNKTYCHYKKNGLRSKSMTKSHQQKHGKTEIEQVLQKFVILVEEESHKRHILLNQTISNNFAYSRYISVCVKIFFNFFVTFHFLEMILMISHKTIAQYFKDVKSLLCERFFLHTIFIHRKNVVLHRTTIRLIRMTTSLNRAAFSQFYKNFNCNYVLQNTAQQ